PTTADIATGEPPSAIETGFAVPCTPEHGPACDPEPAGDTIVLTRWRDDPSESPDFDWYCDSGEPVGNGCTAGLRTGRTVDAFWLEPGTTFRLVDAETPAEDWEELVVLCVTDAPVARLEGLPEEVWGATMRLTTVTFNHYRPGHPELLFALYPHPSGRWYVSFEDPMAHGRDC
ncbi:MAG: hypothetical protein OXG72_11375, partial [Acidobacteria bacterium]|nr:hypothetical protein [Acidobacteriota bacterium]